VGRFPIVWARIGHRHDITPTLIGNLWGMTLHPLLPTSGRTLLPTSGRTYAIAYAPRPPVVRLVEKVATRPPAQDRPRPRRDWLAPRRDWLA
jgi:hypothetical protein